MYPPAERRILPRSIHPKGRRLPTCPSCQSVTGLRTLSCPSCEEGLLLEPGTLVEGRYEIQAHLGKGGMGTVFRARDRDLEQSVAIKFLRTSHHPQAAARFKAEIKLARKVKHPNVCAIWQNGYLDGLAYFVMELVEGRTLRDLVRDQGPLLAGEACGLALQAAAGLRAIHEAGVIHRDVKSPNLMLDTRGVVRVVDFGIAKGDPTRPGPDLTLRPQTDPNQVVGSPEFMSPEQVRGQPLDVRTDIYSLGIVLYELCVGRVPFRGTSAFETMMMHVQQAPPLAGPAVEGVAPDLLPILRRALAKDREQRHPTMRALMSDLRRVQAAFAFQGTATYTGERPAPRGRREIYALLAGLAIGGAGLVLSEFCREGSEPVPTQTPAPQGPAPTPSP